MPSSLNSSSPQAYHLQSRPSPANSHQLNPFRLFANCTLRSLKILKEGDILYGARLVTPSYKKYTNPLLMSRSEERRVGKECRYRWSPYHKKKKTEDKRRGRNGDSTC